MMMAMILAGMWLIAGLLGNLIGEQAIQYFSLATSMFFVGVSLIVQAIKERK